MAEAGIESHIALWRRGLSVLSDFGTATHARAVVVLLVFCCVAFLPGSIRIPPIDRDEARFAQATKQMVETGDYVDIRFQEEVRYKKPVGIYWLQAASVKAASALGVKDAEFRIVLYRIPSFIGATGGVLLTYWAALAFASRRAALLAGVMMASCILLGVEARLAKTDAMLFMTVVAAMGAMARIYLGEGQGVRRTWVLPAIFWTAVAGGILIKGPLILMIAGLTAATLVAYDRNARWLLALRPALGLLFVLLLVLPWFAAIVMKSGGAFFSESVGQDMLSKVASGQESHGAPPGYYLLLFFVTFWPASIFSGLVAPAIWRDWRAAGTRFLLAWLIPSWLVFEIVVTKLPHYVLPLYPAIAILMATRIVNERPVAASLARARRLLVVRGAARLWPWRARRARLVRRQARTDRDDVHVCRYHLRLPRLVALRRRRAGALDDARRDRGRAAVSRNLCPHRSVPAEPVSVARDRARRAEHELRNAAGRGRGLP